MTDDNLTFDVSKLAQAAGITQYADQVAMMVAVFYRRLIHERVDAEIATDLCHTFLAAYFDTVQAKQANEAKGG